MLNLNELAPLKFNLTSKDYDKIYMMWKDRLTYGDIAKEFNMAKSQISIVVGQIVTFIGINKKKYERIKAEQKVKAEPKCSFKDLLLPVDNEATIGTSKVVNGKIYSDGKLWN